MNLNALRAIRRLDEASSARVKTFERLASGSRINHASDDSAGLSVASTLNAKARVYTQALRNINDGVSYLNVADGAVQELKKILFRLREIASQSSNGSFSNPQRQSLNKEAQALQEEYNRVVETAAFNGLQVLKGAVSVQAGMGAAAVLTVDVAPAGTGNTIVWDGTFHARASFAAGISTYDVVPADLDGDGVLDLVTADYVTGTSVLLGNGDGTFKARKSFVTGSIPYSVAVADLNGDGLPDLVTADSGSNRVSVLLGNGDGTFKARRSFVVGSQPNSVAMADFDGDGVLDLVTADRTGNTASVLLGNGDGTFKTQRSFAAGVNSTSVAVADFNGDGVIDLVTADRADNTVSVLLGNGDGTFKARRSFAAGVNPISSAVADFNGDGVLDLASVASGDDALNVFLGNGDGTFQARKSFVTTTLPLSVTVADLNGDGLRDLVTGDIGSGRMSVFLGNGDGTFQAGNSVFAGTMPYSVAVVDLNGDSVLDLVTADNNANTTSVFLGNGVTTTVSIAGLTPLSGVSVATREDALSAQGRVDDYLDKVNLASGSIGVGLSRLSVAAANLQTDIAATKAAEHRITDADIAEDSARLVSTGILQQAASAVLAHALKGPELALKLLRTDVG